MTFGMDVSGVHRTRSYAGENTAGLAKSAAIAEAEAEAPVATVSVTATLSPDGTYALNVKANGQSATVRTVEAEDLADTIARLIVKVTKAAANGDLVKHRQRDSHAFGLGAPRSNRENMRFNA